MQAAPVLASRCFACRRLAIFSSTRETCSKTSSDVSISGNSLFRFANSRKFLGNAAAKCGVHFAMNRSCMAVRTEKGSDDIRKSGRNKSEVTWSPREQHCLQHYKVRSSKNFSNIEVEIRKKEGCFSLSRKATSDVPTFFVVRQIQLMAPSIDVWIPMESAAGNY